MSAQVTKRFTSCHPPALENASASRLVRDRSLIEPGLEHLTSYDDLRRDLSFRQALASQVGFHLPVRVLPRQAAFVTAVEISQGVVTVGRVESERRSGV